MNKGNKKMIFKLKFVNHNAFTIAAIVSSGFPSTPLLTNKTFFAESGHDQWRSLWGVHPIATE